MLEGGALNLATDCLTITSNNMYNTLYVICDSVFCAYRMILIPRRNEGRMKEMMNGLRMKFAFAVFG